MKKKNKLRHALAAIFFGLLGVLIFEVAEKFQEPAHAEVVTVTQRPQPLRQIIARSDLRPEDVSAALQRREELLKRKVSVKFIAKEGAHIGTWNVALAEHPLWILFDRTAGGAISIDRERMKQELIERPPTDIPVPQRCTVLSAEVDKEGVLRAKTDCIAKSGYTYDVETVVNATSNALETMQESVEILLTSVQAQVTDPLHFSERPLTLLSTGRSTFTGSGYGRKQNVRKAVNEHQHNIVIPQGAEFSFNDTLGKVTTGNGWHMALTIFEGVNLRPAPGGGICQASTTVYRAALNAGLPILEQKNHSLYVTYYEPHGVGLDATVFPKLQDFRFKNDTHGPILMQAYTEGDEVTVNLFGIEDTRKVTLEGPYFNTTAPQDLKGPGKKVGGNEIVWVRTVEQGTGVDRTVISAKYTAIPRSLVKKWKAETVVTRGNTEHATAAVDVVASER